MIVFSPQVKSGQAGQSGQPWCTLTQQQQLSQTGWPGPMRGQHGLRREALDQSEASAAGWHCRPGQTGVMEGRGGSLVRPTHTQPQLAYTPHIGPPLGFLNNRYVLYNLKVIQLIQWMINRASTISLFVWHCLNIFGLQWPPMFAWNGRLCIWGPTGCSCLGINYCTLELLSKHTLQTLGDWKHLAFLRLRWHQH